MLRNCSCTMLPGTVFDCNGFFCPYFFQGLEHLMHNLGLGDLEFDPGHTVDQHRPDGFIVPDIDVVEENVLTRETRHDVHLVDIKTNDDTPKSNDGKTPAIVADKERAPIETATADNENTVTWKSSDFEDASFASLHNPKHVHHKPHSHGKYQCY